MTPQLQQAIRLLQLSTIELQQEIQEALDANPLLEAEDEYDSFSADAQETKDASAHDTTEPNSPADDNYEPSEPDSSEAMTEQNIQEDLPLDNNWDDLVSAAPVSAGNSGGDEDMVYQGETSETLQDYLRWQMQLTPFSDTDRAIAE
ncbi:MAG TPA: RNA polymerase factor sigma-54, partial [Rheinheimera sp.]|nr:RNA polymerase factor sigma-54 [Rheinheimera sp.]